MITLRTITHVKRITENESLNLKYLHTFTDIPELYNKSHYSVGTFESKKVPDEKGEYTLFLSRGLFLVYFLREKNNIKHRMWLWDSLCSFISKRDYIKRFFATAEKRYLHSTFAAPRGKQKHSDRKNFNPQISL